MKVTVAPSLLSTDSGQRAQEIIRSCVHCGFCNTTCPTYKLLGHELDGPRGRIYLMKELFENNEVNAIATEHLDRCLTCRNCETTCPSGVAYGELLEEAREFIRTRSNARSLIRQVLLRVLPDPLLFRKLHSFARPFRFLLPRYLREALRHKPGEAKPLEDNQDSSVVLLQGCVQRVLTPDVVQHIADLLERRGVSFRVAQNEQCCGALHLHMGERGAAETLMRNYIEEVAPNAEQNVISSASGCGVTIKDYGRLLGFEARARSFAEKTFDVAEFLSQFEFERLPNIERIAFHPPCTLQHGQQVRGTVETILRDAGYELVPVSDSHLCCGSAGTYSILQADLSQELRNGKLATLIEHEPDVIATANIGCQMHLQAASRIPVVHWVSLLR